MTEITTHSAIETEQLGEKVAEILQPGDVVTFSGNLGAGKTTFTRGLARGVGYLGDVTSPTFTIINEYFGGRLNLVHVDAYRLSGIDDLFETGFFDYQDRGCVSVVEWNENVKLESDIKIDITYVDESTRLIRLEGKTF